MLINQRTTPTTIKVRTRFTRGMPKGSRKYRVAVWGLTLFGRVDGVKPRRVLRNAVLKKPTAQPKPVEMPDGHEFSGGIVAIEIEGTIFSDVVAPLRKKGMNAGGVYQDDFAFTLLD